MWFLRALLLFCFSPLPLMATEKGTADYYQSAPHEYLGKEIRLRVASLTPVPDLTAADKGFVWMEAATGRPQKEGGRILLRIPAADSAKLAKTMNLPSSSGRWLEGVFSGHDSGAVLPGVITQRAPYYLQVSSAHKEPLEEVETASGSLVVAPKPKETQKAETPASAKTAAAPAPAPARKDPEGPKAVLFRTKAGEPLQLRTAKSVKMEADFCEIIDQDGKLSLVGRALVTAILPLPKDGTVPAPAEAESSLRLYAEQSQKNPEAAALLADARAAWEKLAAPPAAVTASAAVPELEDVETAAGMEDPLVESGYPAWFRWSATGAFLLFILLGWVWSRPRSSSA